MEGQYNPTTITLVAQHTALVQLDQQGNLKVNQNGTYTNLSASALVKTGPGNVTGVVVNSHTNGTLKLWDSLTAATTIMFNTITFAAGPGFYPLFGAHFATGMYATIGGTADMTIIYN